MTGGLALAAQWNLTRFPSRMGCGSTVRLTMGRSEKGERQRSWKDKEGSSYVALVARLSPTLFSSTGHNSTLLGSFCVFTRGSTWYQVLFLVPAVFWFQVRWVDTKMTMHIFTGYVSVGASNLGISWAQSVITIHTCFKYRYMKAISSRYCHSHRSFVIFHWLPNFKMLGQWYIMNDNPHFCLCLSAKLAP